MADFDKIKYNNQFNAEKYDRVTIMLPKGRKEHLKALAAARGESVNSYIIRAIDAQEAAETAQERVPSPVEDETTAE